VILLLLAVGYGLDVNSTALPVHDAATSAKPNIIIVGIDSLRPDYIGYMGSPLVTPTLDAFFQHATVFGEAVTPIARTFPSWISLLTGRYPKLNGARYDLIAHSAVDMRNSLPIILRQHGYETIFAMDETRFSNMDKDFGFDEIVTPPVGLNDFLLGTFNDFPMSNLLVNTRIGKWLFPYSYGNRPAFITYRPASFLKLLQYALPQQRDKPLFLAVHFCLPHYPYLWASFGSVNSDDSENPYQASIMGADQQLRDFLALLQQKNLLQHSIVVLISDHGEALELPGDRITAGDAFIPGIDNTQGMLPHFYPHSSADEKVDESVGHGTDVLGLNQYHSVLAFRFYGLSTKPVQLLPGVVTLMDIKPTLLSFLGVASVNDSGVSLRDSIEGERVSARTTTDIFLESDFSPQAIHSVHPETRQLLFEGIDFFQIDPKTTRLTVKSSMGPLILSSKQFADIYHSWILALYPTDRHVMTPILVNLETGQWTNDLRTSFAKKSPVRHMLQALQHFYNSEILPIENS